MKCIPSAGQPARDQMRQHRLARCGEHFQSGVRNRRNMLLHTSHMFTPDEKVLVAVSGGKRQLESMGLLLRLGYQVEGILYQFCAILMGTIQRLAA